MPPKKAPDTTFDSVKRRLAAGTYAPVYLLHGEEGYYIDRLVKEFDRVIPEEDKEFNQYVLFGAQVEPGAVADLCMSIPMMSDRQLVILKEAQVMRADQLNRLARYVASPSPSTILVICVRGAKCKATELVSAIKKHGGEVFESPKVPDYKLMPHVEAIVHNLGMSAGQKALDMLCEFIGSDLSRMHNEVAKLAHILGSGSEITPDAIERNIGFSKDFNSFELIDAIAARNMAKAWRIVGYFESNPKAAPMPMLVGSLFNLFADMMVAVYLPGDKSVNGLMKSMSLSYPAAMKLTTVLRNYNAFQAIEILDAIRRFDAMSKGNGSRQPAIALLRDLIFHIATAPGRLPV